MSEHQFSQRVYYNIRAAGMKPRLSFDGAGMDFAPWQSAARAGLEELLGPQPRRVPLAPDEEEPVQCEGYTRRRVVFDSEEAQSVPCYLLVPDSVSEGNPAPAILCCHGHGHASFGKEAVAGVAPTPEHRADIRAMNCNYAEQMAQAGFVALAPDLRGFGERSDVGMVPGHDACDMLYVKGTLLGRTPLAGDVWDMMRCVDYLETLPYVEAGRIGMMGLSFGGTVTAFTAALEPRIRAADVIGYVNPFAGFGVDRGNFCGSQVLPGLYGCLDTHDVAGLIAPRPLLLEMGRADQCFFFEDLMRGCNAVRRIYRAAGAEERLFADVHDGGHAFSGACAFRFFRKYL